MNKDVKDLKYWKNNCEEDYIKTPISVLRYITELENNLKEAINYTRCCEKLKDKKIKDLLNWVKSDLRQEENHKLGKTDTPYRAEKLRFLRKLIELESL